MRWLFLLGFLLFHEPGAYALLEPKLVTPRAETSGPPGTLTTPLVIGSWNLQWFPGGNPRHATPGDMQKQISGARNVMRSVKPDVLFACEMRDLDALKKLAPDYPCRACTRIPRPPEENPDLPNQGLALASRIPWKEIWALDFSALPEAPDRPHRGILGAAFQFGDRHILTLYGVHLKSNRGGARSSRLRRERAIDYLLWDWKRRGLNLENDYIVILGDFNTSVFNPAFEQEQTLRRLLKMGFTDASDGLSVMQRVTVPARPGQPFPPADFDHVMLSPMLARMMKTPAPWVKIMPCPASTSDHYPLIVTIDLRSNMN